jgi:hypothetical protein
MASSILLLGLGKRSQFGAEDICSHRITTAFGKEVRKLLLRASKRNIVIIAIFRPEMSARALSANGTIVQEVPDYPSSSSRTCTACLLHEIRYLHLGRMLVLLSASCA